MKLNPSNFKILMISFAAFIISAVVMYSAFNIPAGSLKSQILISSNPLLLSDSEEAIIKLGWWNQFKIILDWIIKDKESKANLKDSTQDSITYLDTYLDLITNIDKAFENEQDYEVIFKPILQYIYPRILDLKKVFSARLFIDNISDTTETNFVNLWIWESKNITINWTTVNGNTWNETIGIFSNTSAITVMSNIEQINFWYKISDYRFRIEWEKLVVYDANNLLIANITLPDNQTWMIFTFFDQTQKTTAKYVYWWLVTTINISNTIISTTNLTTVIINDEITQSTDYPVLNLTGEYKHVQLNHSRVYGGLWIEYIYIDSNIYWLVIDSKIEQISFNDKLTDYSFKQEWQDLKVYLKSLNNALVATINLPENNYWIILKFFDNMQKAKASFNSDTWNIKIDNTIISKTVFTNMTVTETWLSQSQNYKYESTLHLISDKCNKSLTWVNANERGYLLGLCGSDISLYITNNKLCNDMSFPWDIIINDAMCKIIIDNFQADTSHMYDILMSSIHSVP